jgi:hypothetical protein
MLAMDYPARVLKASVAFVTTGANEIPTPQTNNGWITVAGHYNRACYFARVHKSLAEASQGTDEVDRDALAELRAAITRGDKGVRAQAELDPALDPIRGVDGFAEAMNSGGAAPTPPPSDGQVRAAVAKGAFLVVSGPAPSPPAATT